MGCVWHFPWNKSFFNRICIHLLRSVLSGHNKISLQKGFIVCVSNEHLLSVESQTNIFEYISTLIVFLLMFVKSRETSSSNTKLFNGSPIFFEKFRRRTSTSGSETERSFAKSSTLSSSTPCPSMSSIAEISRSGKNSIISLLRG